jgi:hypothetical protein
VSSIWMIRAGGGHQLRIIQRAGIRQAAMPETPRGASRHGSGHPGSRGCDCPERPSPRSGITLSDEGGQGERAHSRLIETLVDGAVLAGMEVSQGQAVGDGLLVVADPGGKGAQAGPVVGIQVPGPVLVFTKVRPGR